MRNKNNCSIRSIETIKLRPSLSVLRKSGWQHQRFLSVSTPTLVRLAELLCLAFEDKDTSRGSEESLANEDNGVPVDCPLRFGGLVTTSPPAASGIASAPAHGSCRLGSHTLHQSASSVSG